MLAGGEAVSGAVGGVGAVVGPASRWSSACGGGALGAGTDGGAGAVAGELGAAGACPGGAVVDMLEGTDDEVAVPAVACAAAVPLFRGAADPRRTVCLPP